MYSYDDKIRAVEGPAKKFGCSDSIHGFYQPLQGGFVQARCAAAIQC
jgi:hypothetical protein